MALVECVPNFSEGRDRSVIDAIARAIEQVDGVTLLDVDPGKATNRTVVTFVGAPEPVVEAAYAGIARAAELIDMRRHSGAHARQGAIDVCPLVPVSGITVEECVGLARRLAERVGGGLEIPVYLYEAAATRPERRSLADIRAGEYEALAEKLASAAWAPDFGPAKFNARSGATVIGVRQFLIAYNINLNTRSARIAKEIGLSIREKGRAKRDASGKRVRDDNGQLVRVPGLSHCRATGWYIEEYRCAQVTMNLTDYTVTNMHTVFDRVDELARQAGARVTGSEVVGLVPKAAIVAAGTHYLRQQGVTSGVSETELIEAAVRSLGLSEVVPFEPRKKVIEYRVAERRPLISLSLEKFVDETGSDSPAPGGGSVAALAGALAASLGAMVAALTHGKKGHTQHDARMEQIGVEAHAIKARLLAAIDDDTAAFNAVMRCFGLPRKTDGDKKARQEAMTRANKRATEVPLSVLEACPQLCELLVEVSEKGNQNSLSDAGVAGLMARAAARGAHYNVLINLKGVDDRPWCAATTQRAEQALAHVFKLTDLLDQSVFARLASVD